MSYQETLKNTEPETFTFPSIYEGIAVKVTVVKDGSRFNVLIDNVLTARVAPYNDGENWLVTAGELNDYDLVQEIGDRIEARYTNLAANNS